LTKFEEYFCKKQKQKYVKKKQKNTACQCSHGWIGQKLRMTSKREIYSVVT